MILYVKTQLGMQRREKEDSRVFKRICALQKNKDTVSLFKPLSSFCEWQKLAIQSMLLQIKALAEMATQVLTPTSQVT